MNEDVDKFKTIISKQDVQIKTLIKLTNQLKNDVGRLKLKTDQLQHLLKRSN